MLPLDEKALRKEPFSEGYAVELADGQSWTIPAVKVRIFPGEKEDGSIEVLSRPWYAGDLEKELDVLFGIADADALGMIEAKMSIASRLLRSNYDLPRGAVGILLNYVPGDDDSNRRWDRLTQAILGRDPDFLDDGDEEIDGDPKGPTSPGSI